MLLQVYHVRSLTESEPNPKKLSKSGRKNRNMIELALVLTVLGASAWVGSRLGKREPEEKTQPISKSSYSEISDQITRLNRYKEDIDELSEMIADIMSCSPGPQPLLPHSL